MINDIKKFLNEDQDPKAVEKIAEKVNDLLTNGESIEYIAVQNKPAINISPDSIVLTNKRIIFFRSKSFGLVTDFQDYLWKDVGESHISEAILGSTFKMTAVSGFVETIDYIPKSQARKLYQYAQAKEEEMIEFRRQKELEDKRATSGAITVNTQPEQKEEPKPETPTENPMETLMKLKAFLDNDLISVEDYEAKKKEILSRM
ncbi:PH domain-containing protein [Epilithonimonas xixisoli]|uniref:PH (Pleckstrin Homology) domain-containing protein n=1 Tax=Epilithonimonas xixisoli TaxID=1476462 RepID=A0A4R8IDT0_9FLAO|nr:PH domain-containing protein [Epilithonimonas xixisoli]TDX82955.1 PH (Pleckstrin Homology) domain-containing protein [Epilithonimonas xixisoli]